MRSFGLAVAAIAACGALCLAVPALAGGHAGMQGGGMHGGGMHGFGGPHGGGGMAHPGPHAPSGEGWRRGPTLAGGSGHPMLLGGARGGIYGPPGTPHIGGSHGGVYGAPPGTWHVGGGFNFSQPHYGSPSHFGESFGGDRGLRREAWWHDVAHAGTGRYARTAFIGGGLYAPYAYGGEPYADQGYVDDTRPYGGALREPDAPRYVVLPSRPSYAEDERYAGDRGGDGPEGPAAERERGRCTCRTGGSWRY